MRPPNRVRKPKRIEETSSDSDSRSGIQTHSSDSSGDDLQFVVKAVKNDKILHKMKASKEIVAPSTPGGNPASPLDPPQVPPSSQSTNRPKEDKIQFILAGHANLHKAANNAAQMAMHICRQVKTFSLNDNGQIIKSAKVKKDKNNDKRSGKPATVDEWDSQRKSTPNNIRRHTYTLQAI